MNLMKPQPANEVRFDPNHAVSNIFRVLPPEYKIMPSKKKPTGGRLRWWEEVSKVDGCTITFTGLLLLDSFDLHVLLALVAIAIQKPTVTSANAPTDQGKHLHKSLAYKAPAKPLYDEAGTYDYDESSHQLLLDLLDQNTNQSLPVAAIATCSQHELTKLVCGAGNDQSYKRVKESLFRLLHTTIDVRNSDGTRYMSNMVSGVYEANKNISIAVNPVLTQSLRLNTGARYIKLYLDAFSSLSAVGKLLYTYLSGRTWDTKPHEYTTETLVKLMYPPLEGAAPVTRQASIKRIEGVVTAMKALNNLEGWQVVEKISAKGLQKWVVTRTKTV